MDYAAIFGLWTKASDFPPGEGEGKGEDDGWIWPFNANNVNDTRGRFGRTDGGGGALVVSNLIRRKYNSSLEWSDRPQRHRSGIVINDNIYFG